VRAGEERKLVTILFADLVGSTAYAGDRDPERVRALLERFYEAMTDEIERTGGTVEKFAGDAVMAVFGAPVALEDHAERALHAALAMQRRLAGIFGGEVEMRIGVNTGEVVVGVPREGSFVAGDAVNASDRLQKAAEPGEILAGERTVAAVGGAFEFGDRRVAEAKGIPEGLVARPVQRALTLARPRGAAGLGRAFVGREAEIDLLLATFRRAVSLGEPHLLTIVGEPGIGKTTLVRELWELLSSEEPAPLRRTGRCLPYGDGITYWPLGEIVKEHYGVVDSSARDEIVRRLEGREDLVLALGLTAGGAHPLDTRERLQAAVVGFVEELARERAAVVLVEDVHWAEDDLLDLLDRVVREARAPVLLLATARPELTSRRPGWGAGRNTTTIWLEPLAEQATVRMLDELLAIELPDELRTALVSRSEGNPFFVEELIGALVDDGVLERRDGAWALAAVSDGFSVPDTVHAALAARIDRLPATEKAALQAASIVGRVFWARPVARLLEGVDADYALLEDRDFVRRRGGSSLDGEPEYSFKHALTRDVAYGSIPKARRGRLHATLAEWLDDGDETSVEPSILAYHYGEAVRPEDVDLVWADDAGSLGRLRARAVHWLRQAGDLAGGRYEMEEAVELYTRAAELCDDAHDRALLWRAVGETQALRYDGEGMRTAFLQALEGPLDDHERADALAYLAFQSSIRSAMWSIRLNMALIEDWASQALALADEGTEANVRARLALANIEPVGAPEEALGETAELASKLGSPELSSFVLGARVQAAFDRSRFHEAAELSDQRLALLPGIDDPDHLCEAYEAGAPAVAAVCRFDDARRLADLHTGVSERLSAHHRVHSVSLELELADALGDWDGLAARTDRALAAIEANLATPCVRNPRDLLLCSLAHLCLGDEARSRELERDGMRLAGEGYETYLSGPRLRIALERGDRPSLESLVDLPVERALVWGPGIFAARLDALIALGRHDRIEAEAAPLVQPGTTVEPFALRALGLARGDDELVTRAAERFAALGLDWHAAQLERLRAGLA
jgi:class 3 adenylate cyclase